MEVLTGRAVASVVLGDDVLEVAVDAAEAATAHEAIEAALRGTAANVGLVITKRR